MQHYTTSTPSKGRLISQQLLNSISSGSYQQFVDPSWHKNNQSGIYGNPKQLFADQIIPILNKQEEFYRVQINSLISKHLKRPIDIIIEYDEIYYIARSLDLPLYSTGEDVYEAIHNLKHEIENVYLELLEDNNFSDEWENYKIFLSGIICEK